MSIYIIQSDSGSYFKGHGKGGAVFTNDPEDALVFDNGEDAGQLAFLMNYTLKQYIQKVLMHGGVFSIFQQYCAPIL